MVDGFGAHGAALASAFEDSMVVWRWWGDGDREAARRSAAVAAASERSGAVRRGAAWCGVAWCGVVRHGSLQVYLSVRGRIVLPSVSGAVRGMAWCGVACVAPRRVVAFVVP